jgi:hypothetical protein
MKQAELKELGEYLHQNDLTIEQLEEADFEMLNFEVN